MRVQFRLLLAGWWCFRNDWHCPWLYRQTSHPLVWRSAKQKSIVLDQGSELKWLVISLSDVHLEEFVGVRRLIFEPQPDVFQCIKPTGVTLDLKRRLITPFERLSAVRSEVTQTDIVLLFLLALAESTSSVHPTATKDRPKTRINLSVGIMVSTGLQGSL